MSYDLTIWCTRPFAHPNVLPGPDWTAEQDAWMHDGGRWLVHVSASDRVLDEDIPDEVQGLLPGITHLVHLSLEPLGAPKAARALLLRTAKAIAKHAHGVILDPQAETVQLPRGLKRYVPIRRDKDARFALLELSWWMAHDRLLDPEVLAAFLDLLQRRLPEALPRRYGLYEPPQHVYEETGRAHLEAFLHENLASSVVWHAARPLGHWSFSVKRGCGWQKLGADMRYRCNRASLTLDSAALEQPGWPEGLHRFWREMSALLQPFYGDVRTLGGYTGRLPHVWADAQSEQHPVSSWWWMGVPPRLGQAVVVGEPYLSLWPGLNAQAEMSEALAFVDGQAWEPGSDVSDLAPVPPEIALPAMPSLRRGALGGVQLVRPEVYPRVFPFGPLPAGVKVAKAGQWWRFWGD